MSKSPKRLVSKVLPRQRARPYPIITRRRLRAWERQDTAAAALHRAYAAHRDELLPSYLARHGERLPPKAVRLWRWYVGEVFAGSLRQLRRHAAAVAAESGPPRAAQLRRMVRLSLRSPVPPAMYYKFGMYRPETAARADEFIHRHELKGVLYPLLNTGVPEADTEALNDKFAFARFCEEHDLPTAPTAAMVEGGSAPGVVAPAEDLFVKPREDRGGKGAQLWTYSPGTDEFHCERRGETVPREGLLKHLSRSANGPLLVQRRLRAHPDLEDLALDAVPTCRVVTITDEGGEPEVVAGAFKMSARAGAIVDNFHAGGIAAPIEVATGRLGAAVSMSERPSGGRDRHPLNDAPVSGRTLPQWDETLALVARAHTAFAPRVLVGWDVCITGAGPVLVEGNEQPGIELIQRFTDEPLGTGRFGRLLRHHIERRINS